MSPVEPIHLLLIGDCTLATSYLPDHLRNEVLLAERLRRAYPHDHIMITNEGLDGESIAGFLQRYDRTIARHPLPDYVFVRYGVNDRRDYGIDQFRALLLQLIQQLQHDLPALRILLETGMFVDYPAHYAWDRNRVLQPLYDVIREVAAQHDLPLVDLYDRMLQETARGNWDLRVRGYGSVEPNDVVLGAGRDELYSDDIHWFTNIHPNPRGMRVIASEEVRVLQHHWPLTLQPHNYQAQEYGVG
ncbi:MAG: hypothetical protein H0X37_14410 [Herpetosiphonaceae bacterium]|nr:hypothetical protein [Herpetosiphonaceae bacterium]